MVKLADLYKGLEEEFGYTVDESEKGDLTTEAEVFKVDEFLFITDFADRNAYHLAPWRSPPALIVAEEADGR